VLNRFDQARAAMKTTMIRTLGVVALTMTLPVAATAQARVGVAVTVVGPVTVTRVAAAPAPLKFKDNVLLNDRVVTGENAFARMLLGGKAIVTARERSVVTITEMPGVSTIDVLSGRISVAVDKSRMARGEVVEIRTPNAVSGIRGTIVVAEVAGAASTITVLRGLVDVYLRDPATGHAVGHATPVGPRQRVTVKGAALPTTPQAISAGEASSLSNEFTAPLRQAPPTPTLVADELSRATSLVGELTGDGITVPARLDPLAATGTPATTDTLSATGTATINTLNTAAPTPSATPITTTTSSRRTPTTPTLMPTTSVSSPETLLSPVLQAVTKDTKLPKDITLPKIPKK
jgi:hypothetical protein